MATVSTPYYAQSDLDGEEAGGFIVMNVNARSHDPYQVLEEDGGGYFRTLEEARAACVRWRTEFSNPEIYIYALVGVRYAIEAHPDEFTLE